MSLGLALARLRPAALVVLAAALLLWPAVLDGRPALFTDTALYVSEADYLMQALGLAVRGHGPVPASDPTRLPDVPGAPNVSAAIDGGRSPVWGVFLYLSQRAGGIWLAAWAQAVAAAVATYILFRAAAPQARGRTYLGLMALLAAGSSLPVFATLMMPDVFAGVAAVCMLAVLAFWDRLGRWRRGAVFLLLAFSLATHGSNPILAVLIAVGGAGLLAWTGLSLGEAAKRGAVVVLAAVLAAGVLKLAYQPIHARAGEPIGSPPFLSARVLADGPGRTYLRRACATAGGAFALCRFDREPLADSDDILWSRDPRKGVFSRADAAMQRRLEREDLGFAIGAVAADPLDQVLAGLRNAAVQLVRADVIDSFADQRVFVVDGYWRRTSLPRIMPDAAACLPRGRCAPAIPPLALGVVDETGLALAVVFVGWRLSRADMRAAWRRPGAGVAGDEARRMIQVALVATLILVANAAICGVLSGPFPRYQARLACIALLSAGLLAVRLGAPVKCLRRDEIYKATSTA